MHAAVSPVAPQVRQSGVPCRDSLARRRQVLPVSKFAAAGITGCRSGEIRSNMHHARHF
jgi:hypothetical protein